MTTLALSPYTTADAVRGAVGLTDNELLDSMLENQQIGLELEVDLQQWIPTYAALFDTGKVPVADDTDRLISAYIGLYAQWFIASQALNLMVLAIPQMISDGKSEMRRFQVADIEALQLKARSKAVYYKSLLQESQGTASDATYTPVARGVPDYDPVTNI